MYSWPPRGGRSDRTGHGRGGPPKGPRRVGQFASRGGEFTEGPCHTTLRLGAEPGEDLVDQTATAFHDMPDKPAATRCQIDTDRPTILIIGAARDEILLDQTVTDASDRGGVHVEALGERAHGLWSAAVQQYQDPVLGEADIVADIG